MGRSVETGFDFDCYCSRMKMCQRKYLLNWMAGFPKEFKDNFMAGYAVSRSIKYVLN